MKLTTLSLIPRFRICGTLPPFLRVLHGVVFNCTYGQVSRQLRSWGALSNRISCFVLREMSSNKPFPPYLARTVNKFSGCANFPSILKCDVGSRAREGAPLLTWVSKHKYLLQVGWSAHWPSSQQSHANKSGARIVVDQITLEKVFPPSSLPFPVSIIT